MGNEAWSKIQLHGNLELQNLMALYTLTLRTNLEHFMDSIVYIIYIILNLGKSGVQRFKQCANRSWNKEVMAIGRQPHQVEITYSTCKIKVQTCKMDNSTCESPWEIHLCNLRHLQPTQLDFFSRYFV